MKILVNTTVLKTNDYQSKHVGIRYDHWNPYIGAEKSDIAPFLICLYFSKADLGPLPHIRWNPLWQQQQLPVVDFCYNYLHFKCYRGFRSTNAKGKNRRTKHTCCKQSFSRVIALLMPALVATWMNLKYNILKIVLSKGCFQDVATF